MATIKSEYYRFNGAIWDLHYFKTSADLLVETATYKVMTAAERTAIADYLTTFNVANKLVKLDATAKIPVAQVPSLPYLGLGGGSITGVVGITGTLSVTGDIYLDGGVLTTNGGGITYSGDWFDFGGAQLKNLDAPSLGSDAATKEYVDNLVSAGFKVKDPVKAASTANVSVSVALNALDGYTLASGDRVLLKNQTTASENGVYTLNASLIPVKVATDSTIGNSVFVENGTVNNDYIYVSSVVNTWSVFARPDTISPGNGLNKVGTTMSIADLGVTPAMLVGGIPFSKLGSESSSDGMAWTALNAANQPGGLSTRILNILSAIKLLRGTGAYNTDNTQTVAGAYTLASSKIKSEIGATVPGTTGYVSGDLFFRTVG